MSFTLGNGWDQDFGYFSLRGPRAIGQRLHPMSKKWRAYQLPEGNVSQMSKPYGFGIRSWRRGWGCTAIRDARRRQFQKAVDRNPLYYANVADRPAGALRLGYSYGWYMQSKVRERLQQQWEAERQQRYVPETRSVSATLSVATWEEIEDLLANSQGPAMPENPEDRTLEWLVTNLLAHWADGWRRPGSWERSMLDMMGHAND